MKVGDVVKIGESVGIVVEMIQKKAWRVHVKGVKVNWDTVEPEPHAIVLRDCGRQITMPASDLEVVFAYG